MTAWLCLGSNLDNPFKQLELALKYIEEKCYVKILQKTKPMKTKPYGYIDQPDFVNQLIQVDTTLSATELMMFLKETEKQLGRKQTFKWGPRKIDMDIVFYGDEIINEENLTVPHPGISDRLYLLQMLNDIIPDYKYPGSDITIQTMFKELNKEGGSK